MGTETKEGKGRVPSSKGQVLGGEALPATKEAPRSLAIAKNGIRSSIDFACCMSALMSDLIEGKITPNLANATCNAGGKLLKVIDMQQRYGTEGNGGNKKLTLVPEGAQLGD